MHELALRATRLTALFSSIVAAVVGAGCAGSISRSGFDTNVCGSAESYEPLASVALPAGVQSLTLFARVTNVTPATPPRRVTELGAPCAAASDREACLARFAALAPTEGWMMPSFGGELEERRYVVATRGDEVLTLTSLDAVAALLRPIDTAAEAAFLVTERGYRIDCRAPNVRTSGVDLEVIARTGYACGAGTGVDEHRLRVTSSGEVSTLETVRVEHGQPNCAVGRRAEGVVACEDRAPATLGAYLAEMAALEASAVHAFARMVRELRAHEAPDELVRGARTALRDEVRHTRVVSALARRRGAAVQLPRAPRLGVRGLEAIALENAVEGCVRETFGALQGLYQARRARDPELRAALAQIARDEAAHAALSWHLAAWLDERLDEPARARVATARREAHRALLRELAGEPSAAAREAGAPDARTAQALCTALETRLAA